jgi:hypothetical protein
MREVALMVMAQILVGVEFARELAPEALASVNQVRRRIPTKLAPPTLD